MNYLDILIARDRALFELPFLPSSFRELSLALFQIGKRYKVSKTCIIQGLQLGLSLAKLDSFRQLEISHEDCALLLYIHVNSLYSMKKGVFDEIMLEALNRFGIKLAEKQIKLLRAFELKSPNLHYSCNAPSPIEFLIELIRKGYLSKEVYKRLDLHKILLIQSGYLIYVSSRARLYACLTLCNIALEDVLDVSSDDLVSAIVQTNDLIIRSHELLNQLDV